MQQHHPLAGVGYALPPQHPTASTSSAPPPVYRAGSPAYSQAGSSSKANTGQAGKKARRSSQGGAPADDEDEQPKKKSKQSLSCGECKCDRKVPCSSCIKRGAADACNWEDAKIEPEKQPFALCDDVDELKERLDLVERFLNTLPPTLKVSMRELGIKSFGTTPKNDVPANQMAVDEYVDAEKQLGAIREGGPADSLGCLDTVLFSGDMLGVKSSTRLQERPAEFTAALTSIVAPRVLYTEPATSTNLGLDLCFSQEELDAARRTTLEKVYRLLPSKKECYELIRRYLLHMDWFFSLLHHATFEAEVKRFWEMVEAGRRYEVDPAWLALFYLVLALASDQSMQMSLNSPRSNPEDWAERGAALQAGAQKLLYLSDCHGKPQVRVIQCTVLIACWTVVSAHGSEYGRFSSWLACAIRAAQKLGLHRLTDDRENMPADDAAWPPGKNAVKREGALRLWGFLTFFDHIAASARFKAYMIHPSQTTTPPPSNVNSYELSPTDWHVTAAPPSVLTILEIDREYRDLLANMPDVFQQEHASLEEKDPMLRSKRYLALQGVHNRIVRLHRPFLVKGWDNPKFASSTEACIKAAKVVLVSHHNNLDVNRNLRMMYSHSLSAAIVLAADLFHAIDTGASDAETGSKREVLAMALEIFSETVQEKVASRHLRLIIASARSVLTRVSSLRPSVTAWLTQSKRRTRRAAHAVRGEGATAEKPFAEILQALARQFDGAAEHKPLSQPSHASIVLSPIPQPASSPNPADPLGLLHTANIDVTLPSPFAGNVNAGPPHNSLTSNLFQDMGLIPTLDGSTFDYWSQAQPSALGIGTSGSGASTADGSPFDLAAFLGVGADGNSEQATQALLTQLTGGW
ncbi:hypothetical protein JCM10213v2_003884 [Rhodosporidiobolus nylandii]